MTTAARRRVEKQLAKPYRIAVTRDGDAHGGRWVANVDELPGCTADGETPEQAEQRVRAAMRTWFERAIAEGREIPEPRARSSPNSHSGRLLLRMPQTLHADLARAAEREGVSLNQLIVGQLARSLAEHDDAAGSLPPVEAQSQPGAETRAPRMLRIAIVANLVVLVVAGAIAVGLLVVALTDSV